MKLRAVEELAEKLDCGRPLVRQGIIGYNIVPRQLLLDRYISEIIAACVWNLLDWCKPPNKVRQKLWDSGCIRTPPASHSL
jgi:hypothetical protein